MIKAGGKMVRKQLTIIGLVALFVFVGSTYVLAGRFGGKPSHKGKGFQGIVNSLDLSETQKTQVADIRSSYQNDMDAAHDSMDGIRQKIHDAMKKEPFDENAENELRLALKDASLIKEDLLVLRAKMMNEIKGILTAEQQEVFSEMREERMERMKLRGERKRAMMNCWSDGQGKGQ
jgi:Spy/CpxP family protein refolding chaperone